MSTGEFGTWQIQTGKAPPHSYLPETAPAPNHRARLAHRAGNRNLLHLREGETDKLIAQKLGLCEKTVQHHVHTLCQKMSAANRSQAVIFALRQKIIPLA